MAIRHTAFEPMMKALTVEMLKAGRGAGLLGLSTVKQVIADHQDDIFAAVREAIDDDMHRWFLWEACTHEGKYGDDGEMQCRGTDFKRAQLWELQQHVESAVAEKNKDLTDLRAENIGLTVRLSDAQAQIEQSSKRIEVLEDLLQDIYRGDLGYGNPTHPEIRRIRRELGLV